jgi:hypothetical protein
MTLWLDMLRTPMAAPETSDLRRMRRTWQLLCLLLACATLFFHALHRTVGAAAPAIAGALLLATILYTGLYWRRKNCADDALLASVVGETEA